MSTPITTQTAMQLKLRALLDAHKNKGAIPIAVIPTATADETSMGATDKYGHSITYNSKQQEFIDRVSRGESVVLIGAAGTGKTTAIKGAMLALIQSGTIATFQNITHKHLTNGTPAISISAYTRRATNNIRRNLSDDLKTNAVTIHKLLEYEPVFYEDFNPATGKTKNTMRFEPTRNYLNKLPSSLKTVVIEEASMVAVELNNQIESAVVSGAQFIYLGDIQQLPPVFGSAILGYKMLSLPVIELTEVYRQALDSPIIKLAHRILSGVPIKSEEFPEWKIPGLTIHPWQKKISPEAATVTLAKFFIKMLDSGKYNPETDAVLIPFNKSCGTDELNKHIANSLAKKSGASVYEVIHGFRKSYYSIGDKCLYDREDAVITNIYHNSEYAGAIPQTSSPELDYWGHYSEQYLQSLDTIPTEDDMDFLLRQTAGLDGTEDEDRVRAASHCVTLRLLDSDREITIRGAGELNNLILGYALTVHKSQGSEWDKVFLCLHHSHATMMQRELLYTAVTRAKKELFIICEQDSFIKGIENQRIKGNTLEEKAEWFKGKIENKELQS